MSDENARWYRGIDYPCTSPNAVIAELGSGTEDIELYVNSPGGSVIAASEIYTALKEYPGNITAKIVGIAASSASWIVTAADKVLISPTGIVMAHNSSTYADGDYRDMNESKEMLESIDEAIRNAYRLKTGLSDEELKNLMDNTTWMNAQQAIEYKFADEMMFGGDVLSPDNIINSLVMPDELVQKLINLEKINMKEKVEDDMGDNLINGVAEPTSVQTTEPVNITVDSIMNGHRDIYDAIYNAGVVAERTRMQEIDNLGALGFDDLVNAAKYDDAKSAPELAMDIIASQKGKGAIAFDNMKKDKAEIENVDPTFDMDEDKEAESSAFASMIANHANRKRGVK